MPKVGTTVILMTIVEYALLLRLCDEVDLCTLKLITIALKKQ